MILDGGVVAMPTETVYGLAANALDGKAVAKIFKAKGRPQDNPLIVHITEVESLKKVASNIPEKAYALAEKYWPGPLTMILPKANVIPDEVSAGLDTVGIRMPSHPVARAFIKACGVPLAAPSANISGRPSPTTAEYVAADMDGKIDGIIDGGACKVGVESTIVTLVGKPRLLRPGGITHEQLEAVLGEVDIDKAVYSQLEKGAKAISPGMKYKHYAPKAHVIVLKGSLKDYAEYVNSHADSGTAALCYEGEEKYLKVPAVTYGREDDSKTQAYRLFDALRELDVIGAKTAFARYPSSKGVGLAVYNRLMRAAAFEVIDL